MIVADTGGLYAYLDLDDLHHAAAARAVDNEPGPFIISPFVLAELDYLVGHRLGPAAAEQLLDDVVAGVYLLAPFDRDDVALAAEVALQDRDHRIGLADASVVVLAARHRTTRLLSTDARHFRAIRPLRGGAAFELPIFD